MCLLTKHVGEFMNRGCMEHRGVLMHQVYCCVVKTDTRTKRAQVCEVSVLLFFVLAMLGPCPLPGSVPAETLDAVVPASTSARRTSSVSNVSRSTLASNSSKWSASFVRRAGSAFSMTLQEEAHPLITHAPGIAESIKFIRLSYLEQILCDDDPFPRRQELPKEAFRKLDANCMLVSISHAWFFQRHPDPYSLKKAVLRTMFRALRLKYPVADIVVFFDFLCITQPPWRVGQAGRTPEEQHDFNQAILQMHFCYCYSDAIIHIHVDGPPEDTEVHVVTQNLSELTLKQFGSMIQVTGLERADMENSSSASISLFDEVCEIDGQSIKDVRDVPLRVATVRYLKRPFGRINPIPAEERGWIFLERFITMLKAAMISAEAFDDVIFTNSQETRQTLLDGALLLREAALHIQDDADAIVRALATFKQELSTMRFSQPVQTRCRTTQDSKRPTMR